MEAKDIKEGDKLPTADGESATVEQTEKVVHDEPVKVYNFAVIDTHTYYVGEVGGLVHNECTGESFGTFEKWGKNANEKIASKGWKVGEPINAPTKAGKAPSWTTVRNRYWKNEAFNNADSYLLDDLSRMRKGKAPLHSELKVPMESHHINGRNIPDPHNIKNLEKLWPWEHAAKDIHRYYNGPFPN